ncbi:MAG TPA: class I SAM-dependent methyltransferase [Spirochaetia bacterium]|nr:class I SAM-dependent methyltransferase [Spirochaetia bacterium]
MQNDLTRGSLFETAAEKYEEFRPSYAMGVVDGLVHRAHLSEGARLLEIGCGTGKATRLFAPKGFQMDCVDPGEQLLEIAKTVCKPWPNARFSRAKLEELTLPPDFYDLVFAAQAFHWVDPETRWKRCHATLAPGGTMALLYNYAAIPADGPQRELSQRILALSGGTLVPKDHEEEIKRWVQEMAATGLFTGPETIRKGWSERHDAESYLGLSLTYSDFMVLEKSAKELISEAIRAAVRKNGGFWDVQFVTTAIHGRKES